MKAGLLLALGLGGGVAEMLHQGVRIDAADGIDLPFALEFEFELPFELALGEPSRDIAADHRSQAAPESRAAGAADGAAQSSAGAAQS